VTSAVGQRPRVVLLTGEPGSGKTELGLELARALHVPFLARDQVRRGLYLTAGGWSDEPVPAPTADEAVEVFLRIAEALVGNGVSCVIEYVVRTDRPEDLARITEAADCVVVVTWCANPAARRAARDRSDLLLGRDPDAEAERAERMARVSKEMRRDFDLPVLRVQTDDGYDPELDEIVAFAVGGRSAGEELDDGDDHRHQHRVRREEHG
jgi:predicted kinase